MCESPKSLNETYTSPQCQHFVIRKKRLCRMTVKPGKYYCGEHEPLPQTDGGQDDARIPCPNDPKHTCYARKLEKHLSICNARQQQQPDYIVHNVNAPAETEDCPRMPLTKLPLKRILQVIDKVNVLYDTYLKDNITALPEQPIHDAVLREFNEAGRTESSRRHLRQASSLLRLVEAEGLVADHTAYVELGAGKGQLSYYAWGAWGRAAASRVLLVDRAALRHKRDNKLRDGRVTRVRADLAHLQLERVPAVRACAAVVGYAKHLCGAATDLALRCVLAPGAAARLRGVVLAPCCRHRCARAAYPAAARLQELGIDANDFNVLLGIVSWATCGDGRSREHRHRREGATSQRAGSPDRSDRSHDADSIEILDANDTHETVTLPEGSGAALATQAGELCDTGSPPPGSAESRVHHDSEAACGNRKYELSTDDSPNERDAVDDPDEGDSADGATNDTELEQNGREMIADGVNSGANDDDTDLGSRNLKLSQQQREAVGRRAKALLDWGRVQFLRGRGFDARLVYYVPASVSPENLCIVAKKRA